MPELPEVETICRGLNSSILHQKIVAVNIRNFKLRHPIPKNLPKILKGQKIEKITRRGKYILLKMHTGTLIMHLGMSGTLQIKNKSHTILKHEHLDLVFANGSALCYKDPRRFGAILWTNKNPLHHRLLKDLGPEPFAKNFNAKFLFDLAQRKKCSIKQLIMDNKIVTGIGNIYASEVLFASKINPNQKTNTLTQSNFKKIIHETKKILRLAIRYGGTTIKDHLDSSGKKGSFQNKLKAYGREKQPCFNCQTKLVLTKISGRSTVFCPKCQKNTLAV